MKVKQALLEFKYFQYFLTTATRNEGSYENWLFALSFTGNYDYCKQLDFIWTKTWAFLERPYFKFQIPNILFKRNFPVTHLQFKIKYLQNNLLLRSAFKTHAKTGHLRDHLIEQFVKSLEISQVYSRTSLKRTPL